MSQATDIWYIRFPDGRVVRAASTDVVRQQLGAGRIPTTSTVRRDPDDEWVALEWAEEFADLAEQRPEELPAAAPPRPRHPRPRGNDHPASVASRLDPTRLHTIGIGQVMQELVGALDSTLVQRKLVVALVACLTLGVLLGLPVAVPLDFLDPNGLAVARTLMLAAVWLAFCFASTLLTRLTYFEVSRLRPAYWREGIAGIGRLTFRVAVVQLLVAGGAIALIALVRHIPVWLSSYAGEEAPAVQQMVISWSVIMALVLEMAIWPIFGLALLLAPVLVVEDCRVITGLRQWLRLVQQDTGRVVLYEALAIGLALVIALPLSFPLLATALLYNGPSMWVAATFTRIVLGGLVLTPVFAYMLVANVFIYLNLRYESGSKR
jgi:hypothetical protein